MGTRVVIYTSDFPESLYILSFSTDKVHVIILIMELAFKISRTVSRDVI
jgi:hypothetical protein